MTAAIDPMAALGAVGDPVAWVAFDDATADEREILAEPMSAPLSPWCLAATVGQGSWRQLHTQCRAPGEVDIPGVGTLRFICSCICHAELTA